MAKGEFCPTTKGFVSHDEYETHTSVAVLFAKKGFVTTSPKFLSNFMRKAFRTSLICCFGQLGNKTETLYVVEFDSKY